MAQRQLSWKEFHECERERSIQLALLYAGNGEAVQAVASTHPGVVRGPTGETALLRASVSNKQDVLRELLASGVNPAAPHGDRKGGWTPLHMAAFKSHTACLDTLLKSGADVNARCARGYTPLHAAASAGHADCVGKLLISGANWLIGDAEGHLPLCLSSWDENIPVISRILFYHSLGLLSSNWETAVCASLDCKRKLRRAILKSRSTRDWVCP